MEYIDALIPGYYRCDRCRQDVVAVSRYKGWRLCPSCVLAIVPSVAPLRGGDGEISTEEERQELVRFIGWDERRRKWKPKRYTSPYKTPKREPHADSYFPLCDCGRKREAFTSSPRQRGLFGGPFQPFCPVCEARRMVENLVTPRWLGLWPDRDDEEWLDHLFQSSPRAFEVGVLPDYWYELRRNAAATDRTHGGYEAQGD